MRKTAAILSAVFLITLFIVGFSVAEPMTVSPTSPMISEQADYSTLSVSIDSINDFDDGEYTKEQAEAKITEAEDKVAEVETKIQEAKAQEGYDTEAIEEAEDKLEDAQQKLDDAKIAFSDGDYKAAYEKAEDSIKESEIALEELSDIGEDGEYTKEQAEAKITEAEDKIEEAEEKISEAKSQEGYDTEAIEDAEDKLEDAQQKLDDAKIAFSDGDYKAAYEKAEDSIDECNEALEKLGGEDAEDTGDVDNDESAEENAAEENLKVSVLINELEATDTTEENPLQVSGDVTIKVIIENEGATILIEEVEIKTSTTGVQISSFELSGATLSSGTSVEFTNTIDTGLLGTVLEAIGDPLYQTKIEIKMENDWDYELIVFWRHT